MTSLTAKHFSIDVLPAQHLKFCWPLKIKNFFWERLPPLPRLRRLWEIGFIPSAVQICESGCHSYLSFSHAKAEASAQIWSAPAPASASALAPNSAPAFVNDYQNKGLLVQQHLVLIWENFFYKHNEKLDQEIWLCRTHMVKKEIKSSHI